MKRKLQENIDILFIIPPVLRFLGKSSTSFPLGLGYMVSYLKKEGISAEIYNADIYQQGIVKRKLINAQILLKRKFLNNSSLNIDFAKKWPLFYSKFSDPNDTAWKEIRWLLDKIKPKIIGITSKVVDISSTGMLANIAREMLPESKIIVGGPSAITCPEYLMQNRSIDILVMGEGERTIVELAERILGKSISPDLSDVLGIMYRDEHDKMVSTPPRPLIPNLDDIPFPDRESMFTISDNFKIKYLHEYKDILASRGCPYMCSFCCAYKAWGSRKPRFRSVDNIVSELKYLRDIYNQRQFIFWDDLFTANKDRTIELCEKIIKNKLNISWICVTRLNTLDFEMMDIMQKAGCEEVQLGIESGSDRVLKYIKKGINMELIREKLPIIRKSGLKFRIFLIIGFPTETKEEIINTLDLISEIKPTYVDLSIFCPYPGTELYYELKKKNALDKDFMKSDMWYPYNNYTGTMSNEEFSEIAFKALEYVDCYDPVKSLKVFSDWISN